MTERVRIQFRRLADNATQPGYVTTGSAGMDLHSIASYTILTGRIQLIRTGLAMSMPPGFEAQIRPRSGLALHHGVTVINSPGTIDADYRGEIKVALINLGPRNYFINPGDRIAQMVIAPICRADIELVAELDETDRGSGGFGSTGRG